MPFMLGSPAASTWTGTLAGPHVEVGIKRIKGSSRACDSLSSARQDLEDAEDTVN